MKKLYQTLSIFLIGIILSLSCKKDKDAKRPLSTNKSPIAMAGNDQVAILPKDSVLLDGSKSTDPDGTIVHYEWIKISRSAGVIINSDSSKTMVGSLVEGVHSFMLTVTDDKGKKGMDTIQVTVLENRSFINATVTPIGNLSEARIPYVGAAGNKIVFAGGFFSTGGNYYAVSSAADIYDITTHSWATAQLSGGREGMAVVSCGNKVFFGGGGFFDFASANVDIYDASTNVWTVRELSQPRAFAAAAAVGNKVYFAGGYTDYTNTTESDYYNITTARMSRVIDIFDLSTNSWSVIEMPRPRAQFSAIAIGNKIYFAGGDANNSSVVDIYNTSSNSWSVVSLQGLSGITSGIAKDDDIYWGQQNGEVQIFNTKEFSSSFNLLSYSRCAPSSVVKNNNVIFFSQPITYMGGDAGPMSNQFDIYNTTTRQWSVGVLPFSIAFQSVFQANNTVYMAGGKTGDNKCGREVYIVNW